jgi:hypothetical protein
MFQDEARFGLIAEGRRCWCPAPFGPACAVSTCREHTRAYGAVSIGDGAWDSLVLPRGDTECMQIFLDEVASRHRGDRIVMALEQAGWHKSRGLAVPDNMGLVYLPPYSPELNPVENVWEELREKFFGNLVFADMDAPEERLLLGLGHLEGHPEITRSISAWSWLINTISI